MMLLMMMMMMMVMMLMMLWCSSGWGCYNYDIEALFLLSALSRKRRHADHSEV